MTTPVPDSATQYPVIDMDERLQALLAMPDMAGSILREAYDHLVDFLSDSRVFFNAITKARCMAESYMAVIDHDALDSVLDRLKNSQLEVVARVMNEVVFSPVTPIVATMAKSKIYSRKTLQTITGAAA